MKEAEKLWNEMKKHLDHDWLIEAMEASRRDRLWFYDNLPQLRREHPNKWVAVQGLQVIDADRSHDRLMERLMRRPGGANDVEILQVLPEGTVWMFL